MLTYEMQISVDMVYTEREIQEPIYEANLLDLKLSK